jgi:hypothetical protein
MFCLPEQNPFFGYLWSVTDYISIAHRQCAREQEAFDDSEGTAKY